MSINLSQRAGFATELLATMDGTDKLIGTLLHNPVIIIFDNQGTVDVEISTSPGGNVWKTFPGGEALVLDLRGNHGNAPNYTFDIGTSFYGNGASGNFSIAYVYAKN
jgi:hypothetical protein